MNSKLAKVLIINDDTDELNSIRQVLHSRQNRYIINTASDIKEAAAFMDRFSPDILIARGGPPGQNALDFLDAHGNHLPCPVLVVTDGETGPAAASQRPMVSLLSRKNIIGGLPDIVDAILREWSLRRECGRLEGELRQSYEEFESKIHERTSELVRLNNQLRESEGRFRMMAENIADILWTMDMSLNITYCNPSVTGLLGWSGAEMINRPIEDIFTTPSLNRLIEVFTSVLQNIDTMPKDILIANILELEMKSREGAPIPVEITATMIRDEAGKPVGIHGLAHNISERKKAEEATRERNEHFHALFENSSSVMLILNPRTGEIFDANVAACNFYGYPKQELVRMNVQDININPPEQIAADMESALLKKKSSFQFQHRLSSDAVRDVEVFSGPIRVSGRELLYTIVNDITERKKSDNELKRLKEHYEYLIRISPTATFTVDRELNVTNWNQKAQEITGYSFSEIMGKKCTTFAKCTSIDDCELLCRENPAPITGKECEITTKDGKQITILKNAEVIRDLSGGITGCIESFTDITGLKETKRKLNESLLEKDMMLKEIHNWVKNNMQIMANLLSIHYEHAREEPIRDIIARSISRIESMALIHEELYRSEKISHIVFADYIEQLITYLSLAYDKNKNIRFDISVKDIVLGIDVAIPCALIINEIVSYSLKNSFPDGRKGKISIRFRKSRDGEYTLEITDNGIGVGDEPETWSEESLGFRLINLIVRQMKGHLSMDLKKGTNFIIRF